MYPFGGGDVEREKFQKLLIFEPTDGESKIAQNIILKQGKIQHHGYVMLKTMNQLTFFLFKNFFNCQFFYHFEN